MLFDFATTASFDVDPQNTFTPRCPNELAVPGGDTIVGALNAQSALARLRIGSKDAHAPNASWVATPEQPMFSLVGTPDVDIRWNAHAVVGTYGFELLEGLPHPRDYDFFVWKGMEPDMHPYSERRARLTLAEREDPPGGDAWNRRARTLQGNLLARWAQLYA